MIYHDDPMHASFFGPWALARQHNVTNSMLDLGTRDKPEVGQCLDSSRADSIFLVTQAVENIRVCLTSLRSKDVLLTLEGETLDEM